MIYFHRHSSVLLLTLSLILDGGINNLHESFFFSFLMYDTLLFWQPVMPPECYLESWFNQQGQSNISFICAVSLPCSTIISKIQTFKWSSYYNWRWKQMEQLCVWHNLILVIKGQGNSNFYLHEKKMILGHSTSHMKIYFTQKRSIVSE